METRLGPVPVRPLRLAAVGDVTFGNGVGRMIGLYGSRYPWLSVAPVCAVPTSRLRIWRSRVDRGHPSAEQAVPFPRAAGALAAAGRFAGVDVVSLANDHTLDYGRVAFLDTLRYARRYRIRSIGGGVDLARSRRPHSPPRGHHGCLPRISDVRPPGFDAGRDGLERRRPFRI